MFGEIWGKPGDSGPDVEDLQRLINLAAAPYFYQGKNRIGVTVDGIYGPETAAAVKGFQASRSLTQSGLVDDDTREALLLASQPVASSTPRPTVNMPPVYITGAVSKSLPWWAWALGAAVAAKVLL